jgi:hypothetical protein
MASQINACRSGAFPTMVEEDKDESPHVNADETDEEAQDTCPALDDNCQGTPAAYPPVTGQGHLNGCGLAKAG